MTKRQMVAAGILLLTGAMELSVAQQPAPASAQKTLGATVGVYVFPKAGQNAEQQSKDEAACYDWAVTNSGVDPFQASKQVDAAKQQAAQKQQKTAQATQGAGAKGAVGGAAAGALIGEIASDDAGKGAAYGAAAGLIAGRRRSRAANQQAAAQGQQQVAQAQQATAEQMTAFRKAFSVCLEAKDYLVKF